MDKTQVINNILGIARKHSYVELVIGSMTDPIQLEVSDSMTFGAIMNLKNELNQDSKLPEGIVDEVEVDVSSKDEDVNVITFPNLAQQDYDGSRYELDNIGAELSADAIEEEMLN